MLLSCSTHKGLASASLFISSSSTHIAARSCRRNGSLSSSLCIVLSTTATANVFATTHEPDFSQPLPDSALSFPQLFAPSSRRLLYPPELLHAIRPEFSHGKLLSELSTLCIGGPAKLFCEVHDEFQLASAMRYCSQQGIRFLVIGKGSNCLFDDRGFDGCIILNRISFLQRVSLGVYRVGSGYPFNLLGMQCSKDGFTGLEFASGIPGTVGGAVFMNAGSDGQETAGTLKSVEVVTTCGSKHIFQRGELLYNYRTSPFQKVQHVAAIVAATFELAPSSTCREWQRNYLERRRRTQPVSERTAGCIFRNPGSSSQSAGSLIELAGLKGVSIGGAKVSEVHANFLVNVGGSLSVDIIALISLVKERVKLKFSIDLEEEIVYVPPSDGM